MKRELVSTLLYFDIFSYPLTRDELLLYTGVTANRSGEALEVLNDCVASGIFGFAHGFYYVGKHEALIDRRIKGNKRAKMRMRTARFYSRIIGLCPFVRGVMLSGSISKGYMGHNDDIDYFIVTEPGRLWITRTLLVLFKKIFLLNAYRNFCINYFVDTENLHIREKNRFTATEIAFLIPVYKKDVHQTLLAANSWTDEYYPPFLRNGDTAQEKDPFFKHLIEMIFDNRLGDKLENLLFRWSKNIIHKKFDAKNNAAFAHAFVIKKNELRYLPNRQQIRILKRYCWRLKVFARKCNIDFDAKDLAFQMADLRDAD